MSDEGYLHNKIRQQQDELEKLKLEIEEIKDQQKRINSYKKELYDGVNRSIEKLEEGFIKQTVLKSVNERMGQTWQETHDLFFHLIKDCLCESKESMKLYVIKFCEEVTLQRKDLGIIMSLLMGKGIVTINEVRKLDRRIRKKMEKEGTYDQVMKLFNPIIKKLPINKTAGGNTLTPPPDGSGN